MRTIIRYALYAIIGLFVLALVIEAAREGDLDWVVLCAVFACLGYSMGKGARVETPEEKWAYEERCQRRLFEQAERWKKKHPTE